MREHGCRKSTLARDLARRNNAVLLVLDDFVDALYPGEIRGFQDFVSCSARVRTALSPHIRDLLSRGVPVVLDFPGNTRTQRQWFRELIDCTGVEHELHYIDAPDDLCKRQLRQRSAARPDVPALQRVRLAVRENRLSGPTRITEADCIAAMEELGRTWAAEEDGEVVAICRSNPHRDSCLPEQTITDVGNAVDGPVNGVRA